MINDYHYFSKSVMIFYKFNSHVPCDISSVLLNLNIRVFQTLKFMSFWGLFYTDFICLRLIEPNVKLQ